MLKQKRISLLVAFVASGCASPAAAPPPAPVAVSGAPTAGAPVDESRAAVVRYARNHEYRSFLRDGQLLWCRKETTLGTRFPHTTCISEESLAEIFHQSLLNEDSQQRTQPCNNASCTSK